MMRKAQFAAHFYCVLDYFQPADQKASNDDILIIEADNGPLMQKTLREMLITTYRSATIKTLPGAGHFPYPAPLSTAVRFNKILSIISLCSPMRNRL